MHDISEALQQECIGICGRYNLLSMRERSVLHLLVSGFSTKEAARHLLLSPRTVETHRRRLMKKMAARSPVELGRKYALWEVYEVELKDMRAPAQRLGRSDLQSVAG